jgi:hypothetical protein
MSVSSSKLDALAGLTGKDGTDPKPALLRILTDFYIQKRVHSPDEDRHFTELALRLIEEVDGLTRADIARRLTSHGGAPAAVMYRLKEHLRTHAAGPQPASTPPSPAAQPAQAEPRSVRAQDNLEEVTSQDRAAALKFSQLFFSSGTEQRRSLLRELDTHASVLPLGIAASVAAAARWELEGAALRGRPFEFVRQIERTLAVPRAIAESVVKDIGGEPLLVVAKALHMPTDVVQRILLLINPAIGNSVKRVFDLSKFYEELSTSAALRLISLWRYSEPLAAESEPANPLPEAGRERRPAGESPVQLRAEPRFEFKPRDQRAS